MPRKLTTEECLGRFKEVHEDRYDYSQVVYHTCDSMVVIGCRAHGDFEVSPYAHWNGVGCPICSGYKKSQNDFIHAAKQIHGEQYDYSKVNYVSSHIKVSIGCPLHGEFRQVPSSHESGVGCPKCGQIKKGKSRRNSNADFVENARRVHGEKYDYSNVDYKTQFDRICIICPTHGEFVQLPKYHLKGAGCAKCAIDALRFTTANFISIATRIHGDRFDYSNVRYVSMQRKVHILCRTCGTSFEQIPNSHLQGAGGCPHCANQIRSSILREICQNPEYLMLKREIGYLQYERSRKRIYEHTN